MIVRSCSHCPDEKNEAERLNDHSDTSEALGGRFRTLCLQEILLFLSFEHWYCFKNPAREEISDTFDLLVLKEASKQKP